MYIYSVSRDVLFFYHQPVNWRGVFCVEVARLFHLGKIFLLLPP